MVNTVGALTGLHGDSANGPLAVDIIHITFVNPPTAPTPSTPTSSPTKGKGKGTFFSAKKRKRDDDDGGGRGDPISSSTSQP
jgi:hypothetical protein